MKFIRRRNSTSPRSAQPDRARRALLATGAVAGAGALVACATSAALPPVTSSPTGAFISIGETRLHYRIIGAGPKAVVIHGASGNLRDWTLGPAAELAKTNTLLLFDRPGLGFSDRAPQDGSNPFVQARLMRQAAAELGFGRAHVIGHSYGGAVALAWALDAPETVTGLLAIAAASQVWEGGVDLIYHLTGPALIGPVFSRILPAFASQTRVREAIASIFEPQQPPASYMDNIGVDLTLRPRTLQANGSDIRNLKRHIRAMVPRYPSLRMPVELVHGTADTIVPLAIHSEKLVTQIPDATLTRLPGIGHMPHHVATPQVAAALKRLNAKV